MIDIISQVKLSSFCNGLFRIADGRRLASLLLTFSLLLPSLSVAMEGDGFQNLQGQPQRISEYLGQGQWTVVMIWASDCHACNAEAASYVKFHEMHKMTNATVLGVSLDGPEKLSDARQFVARHKVSFPNVTQSFQGVARFYTEQTGQSLVGTPTIMVYAPNGEIRAAQVGAVPTEVIEQYIESQSAAGSAETPS